MKTQTIELRGPQRAWKAYVEYTPGKPKIFKSWRPGSLNGEAWGVLYFDLCLAPIIDWFDSFENALAYFQMLEYGG